MWILNWSVKIRVVLERIMYVNGSPFLDASGYSDAVSDLKITREGLGHRIKTKPT